MAAVTLGCGGDGCDGAGLPRGQKRKPCSAAARVLLRPCLRKPASSCWMAAANMCWFLTFLDDQRLWHDGVPGTIDTTWYNSFIAGTLAHMQGHQQMFCAVHACLCLISACFCGFSLYIYINIHNICIYIRFIICAMVKTWIYLDYFRNGHGHPRCSAYRAHGWEK